MRQLGDQLGPALGAPEQLTPRVRLAPFYNALIVEVDGEAWVLAEATVADRFAPSLAGNPMSLGGGPPNDPLPPRGGGLGRGGDSPSEVLNTLGQDVAPALQAAADAAGCPPILLLAGAIAESGLNPRAERWGRETAAAKTAIVRLPDADARQTLQEIIDRAWPDVSFGYSQRIVRYHEIGDRSATVDNCLTVRAAVFADPDEDLRALAQRLATHWATAQSLAANDRLPVELSGSSHLGALIIYNAGHLPAPGSPWWSTYASTVATYRWAFSRAREIAP